MSGTATMLPLPLNTAARSLRGDIALAESTLVAAEDMLSVSLPGAAMHPWHTSGLTYRLSTSRKTKEELKQLRRSGRGGAAQARFYEEQNELIDDLLTPVNIDGDDSDGDDEKKVTLAVRLSLAVNVLLCLCQGTAAVTSGSMSLVATAADSFMDLLSGTVLLFADRAAKRQNVLDYPTGKRRFEVIGVVVFACLMASLSLQLVFEGARKLVAGEGTPPDTALLQIVLVCVVLAAKVMLLIYCSALRQNVSARTLVVDHRNDLVLNSFGLTMSLLGSKFAWWLDAIGGVAVGLLILRSWASEAWESVQLLIGKSASPAFLNKITYLSATHHPKVLQVDTCRAYWLGSNMFVEVDIVLPPNMTLRESHDIGEALQVKLEALPNVERAFVHCDWEYSHRPEH